MRKCFPRVRKQIFTSILTEGNADEPEMQVGYTAQ